MMIRTLALSLALAVSAGLTLSSNSFAAKLQIGDKAPSWTALEGVDGRQHSLSDFDDAHVLAVVFTCNYCPIAVAYEERLIQFASDYQDKGVRLVAINVNEDETVAEMKDRAEEAGFNFPYLYDASQQSAIQYGATVTPHVFLLDKDRALAYMGAVDNRQVSPTEHYLRNAADALLAGKQPEPAVTRQFGCGIKWKQ